MAGTLASLLVSLDLDVDKFSAGAQQAVNDTDKLVDRITKVGDQGVPAFLRTANALAAIPTAAHGLGAVVGILGSMSGAIGLIPAAGAGAVVAISALKVGVQGFGDAIKNVGDPKKFAESLKELSPAARESAVAVRDLSDEWSAMQDHVQDQLFEGLADDINRLGKAYTPVLAKGLGDVNAQFNAAAQRTAGFLAKTEQVKDVAGVFDNTTLAVAELTRGIQPLVQIMLDLVAVGSEFLPGLVGGFGDAAASAAEFVRHARETGQLREWISGGLSALGDLWQLLRNIAGIAATVFSAFKAEGADTLGVLIGLTAQVRDFLRSAEGQEALHSLAEALGTIASVVSKVLLAALKQLAPIIREAAPGFAELARQVGTVLVAAIETLGPKLVDLAGWLSDNIDWLGPLAIGLYGAAKAFGAVSTAVEFLTKVSKANPWVLIISTLIVAAIFIVTKWDEIKAFLLEAWTWIKDTANSVWTAIKDFFVGIWTDIRDFFVNSWTQIKDEANAKWNEIKAIGTSIWTQIKDFFVGIWTQLKDEASAKWNQIKTTVSDAVQGVQDRVKTAFTAARDKVVETFNDVVAFVRDLPRRIREALGDLGDLLVSAGKAVITGLLRGIKNAVVDVYNFVSGIAGQIAALKGPLPKDRVLLTPAGVAIMQGLLAGLRSQESGLISYVTGLTDRLAEAGSGWSMTGPVAAAVDSLNAATLPDLASPSATGFSGAVPAPRSAGGGGTTLQFEVIGGRDEFSEFMGQLMRRYVRVRGGDVQAVIGGAG